MLKIAAAACEIIESCNRRSVILQGRMKCTYSWLMLVLLLLPVLLPTSRAFLVGHLQHRSFLLRPRPAASTNTNQEEGALVVDLSAALTLQQQAQALREEALSLQRALNESKTEKLALETAKVDQWLEEVLVNQTISENTQLLNTVEQVMEILKDGRFSADQVNKMFNRICDDRPQSRSNCSPIMSLLVDAAGKLDNLEKEENPNKRWSGRVERVLRKRLFAMDWGMDLEEEDE